MQITKLLHISVQKHFTYIKINRPDKKNALNEVVITNLINIFTNIGLTETRAIILSGSGPDFCSGLDLNWMKDFNEFDDAKSSKLILKLYDSIRKLPIPIIACVSGTVIAGGVGLMAVCDIVIADSNSKFAMPEVRLGLVPALMAPFVCERIGLSRYRELCLTGRSINSEFALKIGLIDFLTTPYEIDELLNSILEQLLKGGKKAQAATKEICRMISNSVWDNQSTDLANILGYIRQGSEAQEGINSFFEKRYPSWQRNFNDE